MPESSQTDTCVVPGAAARAAFIALPVAVLEAVIARKISRDAAWLYACLLYHLNRKRGGNRVWPSREELAIEMGITKPSNVDKYVRQLVDAGFVMVSQQRTSGGLKTRNIYTLLCLRDEVRSPKTGTSGRPAKTQITAAGANDPKLGLRSPDSGTQVVPKLGPEPDEVPPEERNPLHGHPNNASERVEPGVEEAIAIIDKAGHNVYGSQRLRLVEVVARAMAAGWSQADIIAELRRPTTGLADIGAGLIARIRNLGAPPAPEPEQPRPEPCPIHRGSINWRTCSACWGARKAGEDPYEGRDDKRPDGWHDVYAWTPRPRTIVVDEVEIDAAEPDQRIAQIANTIKETP